MSLDRSVCLILQVSENSHQLLFHAKTLDVPLGLDCRSLDPKDLITFKVTQLMPRCLNITDLGGGAYTQNDRRSDEQTRGEKQKRKGNLEYKLDIKITSVKGSPKLPIPIWIRRCVYALIHSFQQTINCFII